jgi:hypothetical protein
VLSTGTGLSPTMADLSKSFPFLHQGHWPGPRSLATTNGVSVDVLSSRYLDVSVPWVSSLSGDLTVGFPHSEILGSKFVRNSPRLIAAYYVLHRLHAPRHPLNALKTLDRSHYQCPQSQRPNPLLYGLAPPSQDRFSYLTQPHTSSLKRYGWVRLKNQISRAQSVSLPGYGIKRDRFASLYNVQKIRTTTPDGINQPNLFFRLTKSLSFTHGKSWWSQTGSNRRHPACKAGALPAELWPQNS